MREMVKMLGFLFVVMLSLSACSNDENDIIDVKKDANLPVLAVSTEGYTAVVTDNLEVVLKRVSTDLSEEEIAGLLLMREEELLARDVYAYFSGIFDLPIFANITRSESTHTEAVLTLLNTFGIDDPATGEPGGYSNEALQQLYGELTARGETSLVEALKVGAYIEELDIKDLDELMAATDNANILMVYSNLQKGSRNHLRAFVRVLNLNGVAYEPVILDAATYEAIIRSGIERGNVYGTGFQGNSNQGSSGQNSNQNSNGYAGVNGNTGVCPNN